jgi:hypothetical protein
VTAPTAVCAPCRRGSHQHDRHTGRVPGTVAGADAAPASSSRATWAAGAACKVVLPVEGRAPGCCPTCGQAV